MKYSFDTSEFSRAIKTKRVIELSVGLREVAKKIKISAATLSRFENEAVPEMKNFLTICTWLERLPREFIAATPIKSKPSTTNTKNK